MAGTTRRRTRTRDGPLPVPRTAAPRRHPRASSRERRPTWARLTDEYDDIPAVALIADASNNEINRLNARAQHLRAERGELGREEIPLPGVHYGLRQGDLIACKTQHRPRGQPRVENGARGEVAAIHEHGVTVQLGPRRPGPRCGIWQAGRLSEARFRFPAWRKSTRALETPMAAASSSTPARACISRSAALTSWTRPS